MQKSIITQSNDEKWDLIIQPQRRLLDLRLGELWKYRDLVMLFVRRDFVSVYKQTILGPLWYLIQPLLTTIMFTFIFGQVANLPTDGLPQFLFYMSGTVIWSYFADCLTKTSNTFVQNSNLFGKVYFPRMAVPVSILISNLITFFIQFTFSCGQKPFSFQRFCLKCLARSFGNLMMNSFADRNSFATPPDQRPSRQRTFPASSCRDARPCP